MEKIAKILLWRYTGPVNTDDIFRADFIHMWHSKSDEERLSLDPRDHTPHPESEIFFIFCGNVEFIIEGYRYALLPEAMLLIPPETIHGWRLLSPGLFHRFSVHFLPEYLDEGERSLFLGLFSGGPRYFPSTSSKNINFFIQTLINSMHLEEALRPVAVKSRLLSLLTELRVMLLDTAGKPVPVDGRILRVLSFLQEHLREKLSLEGLARRFNIDKNYLNILFRRATGTTVNRYIRFKRLALVRQEILRGANPEDAAYRAGFNDYSNFYRAYKALYGSMPSAPGKGIIHPPGKIDGDKRTTPSRAGIMF
ncbi:MAG: AraC family transcriptional regulator [Treponema sp.]|jgi:AraC-like DNA-binding protein/mannose-6-phosphate isomerase-like protein (cupin superfamily)|nr:AraC family transcriptional regulator [Treponema sp.]